MHDQAAHIMNTAFLDVARAGLARRQQTVKSAFVPGGDPAAMMDPAAAGGGGADPSMGMGGAPAGGGGGGGAGDMQQLILQKLTALEQTQAAGTGGGAGGAQGLKPKIDVNVEIMQMKNMLAKLCDALGVHIPAQDMTATSDKLTAMAQGMPTDTAGASGAGAGVGAGAGAGAIPPIDPMQGMQGAGVPGMPGAAKQASLGTAFDSSGLEAAGNKAAMLVRIRKERSRSA